LSALAGDEKLQIQVQFFFEIVANVFNYALSGGGGET